VVIIFSGGLEFEFARVISSVPRAIVLVLLGVGASIAAAAAFAYYMLDWELMDCLLLGAIVGGTGASIVVPLMSRAKVPTQVSSLLSLESVLNSPLVIVIALVLLEVMTRGTTGGAVSTIGQAIGIRFAVGIGIGIAAGFFWLWILTLLEKESYSDITTLAVVFLFYFVVESINGSGVIFALVFGLILGNSMSVTKLLRIKRTIEAPEIMKRFHSQISFFIKTFFFIYLGLIISFNELRLIIFGVLLSLLLLFTRYIVVLLTSIGSGILFANSGILTTMFARGESAAVLVQIVVAAGISNASAYSDIIISILVTTVVISAIGILIFARKPPGESAEAIRAEPQ
jgi:cell volume regulation protein A